MLVLPGFIMCFTAPRFLYDCQFEEWETAAAVSANPRKHDVCVCAFHHFGSQIWSVFLFTKR